MIMAWYGGLRKRCGREHTGSDRAAWAVDIHGDVAAGIEQRYSWDESFGWG